MREQLLSELNNTLIEGIYLSDKGTVHSYLPVYEELFAPYRYREINIFEVGYLHGGSSRLFEKYFTKARILSIDVDHCVPVPTSERIQVKIIGIRSIGPDFFKDFIPDIAIDDGSHQIDDQVHFIKTVYPVLRKGGILIVEDIQDINNQLPIFNKIGIPFSVYDRRSINGRYDDVLLIYRK